MSNSVAGQVAALSTIAAESTVEAKYVTGETRYMKIKNLGRAVGLTRTLEGNTVSGAADGVGDGFG